MMKSITEIARLPAVRAALAAFHDELESIVDQIIAIQQIPAPTFAEEQRARYAEQQFAAAGMVDVRRDELTNVYGRLPGQAPGGRPPLVISAHLDTVFNAGTDLTVRREGPLLYGAGIGDNSTGVAGLIEAARAICEHELKHAADIHFVANVGEEGMGDLCGMRAVVDHFGPQAVYVVVEGGLFGKLIHQAISVRRYRIDVTAPGGHSWGGFGATSAIHVLGHLIVDIDNLIVPSAPRTTYNVGIIDGGMSVNTIANEAQMWLDLRSEDTGALENLVRDVVEIVAAQNQKYRRQDKAVKIVMHQVGDRPAGSILRESPIVVCAENALRTVGCEHPHYISSSTDANIPLGRGYQAVCLGLTHSANSHRPDEYIDVTQLPNGMGQLLLVALAAAN